MLVSCSSQPKNEPYEYFSSQNNNYKEIIVEGMGTNFEDAERNARVQALQNIVGMKVYNETKTKNFKLVDKTILSKTYGFIKGSEIIDKYEKNGIYFIKVKYKVSENVGDEDFFYILHQMKKPKIGVYLNNISNPKFNEDKTFEISIESSLNKYGFNLFDSNRIKEVSNKLKLAGEGLDILVLGDVYVEYSGEYYGLKTARSKITLKAYWTSTGKLITSISSESGGSDVTIDDAMRTAIKKSSEIAGDKLGKEILKKWMDYLANGIPIQIIVLNISNDEYKNIYAILKNNFNVFSYEYTNGNAIFEIESDKFTDEIYNLYFSDRELISQSIVNLVIK
jgi:hypothetical protein